MSELTLLILRIAFLVILWLFIFGIVYALRSDLFGSSPRRQSADAAVPAPAPVAYQQSAPPVAATPRPTPASSLPHNSAPAATALTASRLVVTIGPKAGIEIPLGSKPLTIGRSSESGLVIRDDYTSTHHARLMLLNDSWVIQDLDSTNGTFLDGIRVDVPTQVPLGAPVKIGTTSFELRR
ncbi:FHA domain-containing protein [Marisediminicola sp. LYQ85]|uniref:FHA domain-containing protein FhaB/FipA n=1 Tax=Marisediminicola sp. LYQ85 TaxID=3391062 RepID=UPI0039834CD0